MMQHDGCCGSLLLYMLLVQPYIAVLTIVLILYDTIQPGFRTMILDGQWPYENEHECMDACAKNTYTLAHYPEHAHKQTYRQVPGGKETSKLAGQQLLACCQYYLLPFVFGLLQFCPVLLLLVLCIATMTPCSPLMLIN